MTLRHSKNSQNYRAGGSEILRFENSEGDLHFFENIPHLRICFRLHTSFKLNGFCRYTHHFDRRLNFTLYLSCSLVVMNAEAPCEEFCEECALMKRNVDDCFREMKTPKSSYLVMEAYKIGNLFIGEPFARKYRSAHSEKQKGIVLEKLWKPLSSYFLDNHCEWVEQHRLRPATQHSLSDFVNKVRIPSGLGVVDDLRYRGDAMPKAILRSRFQHVYSSENCDWGSSSKTDAIAQTIPPHIGLQFKSSISNYSKLYVGKLRTLKHKYGIIEGIEFVERLEAGIIVTNTDFSINRTEYRDVLDQIIVLDSSAWYSLIHERMYSLPNPCKALTTLMEVVKEYFIDTITPEKKRKHKAAASSEPTSSKTTDESIVLTPSKRHMIMMKTLKKETQKIVEKHLDQLTAQTIEKVNKLEAAFSGSEIQELLR